MFSLLCLVAFFDSDCNHNPRSPSNGHGQIASVIDKKPRHLLLSVFQLEEEVKLTRKIPTAKKTGRPRGPKGVSLNVRISAIAKGRIQYAAQCRAETEELSVGMNREVNKWGLSLPPAPGERPVSKPVKHSTGPAASSNYGKDAVIRAAG